MTADVSRRLTGLTSKFSKQYILHEFTKEVKISDERVHIYVTLDHKGKQIEK